MKQILYILVIGISFLTACKSQNVNIKTTEKVIVKASEKKIKVFFLAGQSNMDGRARAFNLTEEDKIRLAKAKKNVTLYYNHQEPVSLQVTVTQEHAIKNFGTDKLFGPELFFGIELSEKYPNHKIILIKRSRGGMSLYGAWNPDWTLEKATKMKEDTAPKLYTDFISYTKEILKDFNKEDYELSGMLWVQGETDSAVKRFGTIPGETYEENLTDLINGVRTEFSTPKLPFIIFQVGHGKVVKAMQNIANNDAFVSFIPQSKDENSDIFYRRNPLPLGHYTYVSMKKIGTRFFEYYQKDYK